MTVRPPTLKDCGYQSWGQGIAPKWLTASLVPRALPDSALQGPGPELFNTAAGGGFREAAGGGSGRPVLSQCP